MTPLHGGLPASVLGIMSRGGLQLRAAAASCTNTRSMGRLPAPAAMRRILPVVSVIAGVFMVHAVSRLNGRDSRGVHGEAVVVPEQSAERLAARRRIEERVLEFKTSVNNSLLWRAPGWPRHLHAANKQRRLYVTWDRNAGGLNNQLISAAAAFDTARALNRTVFVRSELLEVCVCARARACVCPARRFDVLHALLLRCRWAFILYLCVLCGRDCGRRHHFIAVYAITLLFSSHALTCSAHALVCWCVRVR